MQPIKEAEEKPATNEKVKRENEDDSGNDAKKQKTEAISTRRSRTTRKETKKATEKSKESQTETKKDTKKSKTEDEKRKNFLERNRVAASKCRQRKKQLINKMEEELSYYSSGYRELSAHVSQLRDQLITLKGIIVGHKDCNMLAQSVGGFEQLNNIIQQANYVTQISCNTQQNITSMPSTIPTTLNNTQMPGNIAPGYQAPPLAPTQTVAPLLPIPGNQMMDQHIQNNNSGQMGDMTTPSSTGMPPQHGLNDMQSVGVVSNSGALSSNHSMVGLNQAAYNDGMIEESGLPVV